MAKQSKAQKETIERVMHEFKHGELKIRGTGPKVKNPKQAIAIALHEAGATNQESPQKNRETLKKTKAKERKGETARDSAEAPKARRSKAKPTGAKPSRAKPSGAKPSRAKPSRAKPSGGNASSHGGEKTRAELYEEAKRRDVPGRSSMSKSDLERALAR